LFDDACIDFDDARIDAVVSSKKRQLAIGGALREMPTSLQAESECAVFAGESLEGAQAVPIIREWR
jgi:hypothetical protein